MSVNSSSNIEPSEQSSVTPASDAQTDASSAPLIRPVADQQAPLRAAVRYGTVGLLVLTVVGTSIAWMVDGTPGVWGALMGAAVGGGFILFTAVSVLVSARLPATTAGAVILGGWLLKMILAFVVLVLLKGRDFYSPGALVAMIVGALFLVLGAETLGVLRQRVPYIVPHS
jgi:hypothetical protein